MAHGHQQTLKNGAYAAQLLRPGFARLQESKSQAAGDRPMRAVCLHTASFFCRLLPRISYFTSAFVEVGACPKWDWVLGSAPWAWLQLVQWKKNKYNNNNKKPLFFLSLLRECCGQPDMEQLWGKPLPSQCSPCSSVQDHLGKGGNTQWLLITIHPSGPPSEAWEWTHSTLFKEMLKVFAVSSSFHLT